MAGKDQKHPVMQVVGFHVEGASPSPPTSAMLMGLGPNGAGSPVPVIIPPSFGLQRESSRAQGTETGTATAVRQDIQGTAGGAVPVAPQPPVPAPAATAEAARLHHQLASAPKSIQQAERSELSHSSLNRVPSLQSITSEHASPMSSVSGMFGMDSASTRATPPPTSHIKPDKKAAAAAPEPKPKLSKAENRANQEAQRAAKAAQKADGAGPSQPAARDNRSGGGAVSDGGKSSKSAVLESKNSKDARSVPPAVSRTDSQSRPADPTAGYLKEDKPKRNVHKVVSLNSTELFAHLPQYQKVDVSSLLTQPAAVNMHAAILQLGLRYADGSIRGSNARCLAMLHAFCQVIQDYTIPEGKELSRDLLRHVNDHVNFLVICRPLSVGMGNAIRQLKMKISQVPPAMLEAEAKEQLLDDIQEYIATRITSADTQLTLYGVDKVNSGDVILTYAASYVVHSVLMEAARRGKAFRVVVMDSRPELEGRITLQKLLAAGIPCTYVHITAASYIIREVTKVFLGAAAVLSNGTVLSRAGTAAVAMMAHAHSKPVMICCETHKFNERVQLDSITHNELGNPEALVAVPGRPEIDALKGWHDSMRLRLLNLKYDVMPAEYVTMIVTEFGMMPPTSVPVILRELGQAQQPLAGPF